MKLLRNLLRWLQALLGHPAFQGLCAVVAAIVAIVAVIIK